MVAQRVATIAATLFTIFIFALIMVLLGLGFAQLYTSAPSASAPWEQYWVEIPLPPEFDSTCYRLVGSTSILLCSPPSASPSYEPPPLF